MTDLRERLRIGEERLEEVNEVLLDPKNEIVNQLLEVIERLVQRKQELKITIGNQDPPIATAGSLGKESPKWNGTTV